MGSYETTMLKLEQMAQKNTAQGQQWQERMSNTSHQREVKDLVAAGLNPVLSSGGSGAQSYTTQVDSAVSGIAGMASAREGANAQRYAARQSAAATRAAAAAQMEAARIAAAASNYAADQHRAATEYATKHSKTGTPWGILSNAVTDNNNGFTSTDLKGVTKDVNKIKSNPNKYLLNPDRGFTFNNLNWRSRQFVQRQLRDIGVSVTMPNQIVVMNAFFNNDKSSMQKFTAWAKSYNKRVSSAVSHWSNRSGSGIW